MGITIDTLGALHKRPIFIDRGVVRQHEANAAVIRPL
jgi:hypothetical protein